MVGINVVGTFVSGETEVGDPMICSFSVVDSVISVVGEAVVGIVVYVETEVGVSTTSVVVSVISVVGKDVVCMASVGINVACIYVADVAVLVGRAVESIASACEDNSVGLGLFCGLKINEMSVPNVVGAKVGLIVVGKDVGELDGCNDGVVDTLGLSDGCLDGIPVVVGFVLGRLDGAVETDGCCEGIAETDGVNEGNALVVGLDDTDGLNEGDPLGLLVGLGDIDGWDEGEKLGLLVGLDDIDGKDEGDTVGLLVWLGETDGSRLGV